MLRGQPVNSCIQHSQDIAAPHFGKPAEAAAAVAKAAFNKGSLDNITVSFLQVRICCSVPRSMWLPFCLYSVGSCNSTLIIIASVRTDSPRRVSVWVAHGGASGGGCGREDCADREGEGGGGRGL